MYSFPNLEPVRSSMSSSNFCFLTCIQISQEAGKVVWQSHLFKNFPQFVVIHTVKGFGIVNKAKVSVFLELSCFFNDPVKNIIDQSVYKGICLFLRVVEAGSGDQRASVRALHGADTNFSHFVFTRLRAERRCKLSVTLIEALI